MTEHATKADRILRNFQSFDADAEYILKLISQLHTSRVSGYGFTAEADVLGVDRYQITEQLDNLICPVCRVMHGKTFQVEKARDFLSEILFEEDPEIIKSLQPWPSQKTDDVDILREMTEEEIVAAGWHIPPYHPWCRGLLVHVGSVDLDEIPDKEPGPPPFRLGRQVTLDDIEEISRRYPELELNITEPELWEKIFQDINPLAVFDHINDSFDGTLGSAMGEMEFLFSTTSLGPTLNLVANGYTSTGRRVFELNRSFKSMQSGLYAYHEFFKIGHEFQKKGYAKNYLRAAMSLYAEMGVDKVFLSANIEVGSYAWAKYGFKPTDRAMQYLSKDLSSRLETLVRNSGGWGPDLSEEVVSGITLLIDKLKTDPTALWAIADMGAVYNGQKLGYWLLESLGWAANLSLSDEEAMARFWRYVGR